MRFLTYFILSIILVATIYITMMYFTFSIPITVIPAHLVIILYGMVTVFVLLLLAISNLPEILGKIVTFTITGISLIFLISVYILSYIGKYNWNQYISLKILFVYTKELSHVIDSLHIDTGIVITSTIILLIIGIAILLKLSNLIFLKIKHITVRLKNKKLLFLPINCYMLILLLPYLIIITPKFFIFQHYFIKKYQEPIVTTLCNNAIRESIYFNPKINIADAELYPVIPIIDPPNIILVIADALRADHMGVYQYDRNTTPFLSELLNNNSSIKVKYAYSTSSHSTIGISNIFSSRYKLFFDNFFIHDILKIYGYKINFILSGDHTNFYSLREYYGGNMDKFMDGYTTSKSLPKKKLSVNDDHANIIANMKNITADGNPTFFYFHFMSTHALGKMYPENNFFKPYKIDRKQVQINSNNELIINRYDNKIIQFDSLIKELYYLLSENGFLENSIMIITSDHGEPLYEKGYYRHGHSVYYNDINVPFIIIDHIQQRNFPNYSPFMATHLDIAPTILDLLGLPVPNFWEGQSIFENRKSKYTFHHEREYYSVIETDNTKIFQYIYNKKSKADELYNLVDDPTQKMDIIRSFDKIMLANLRSELSNYFNIEIRLKN